MGSTDQPDWTPSADRIASSQITAFLAWLQATRNIEFPNYESLWAWSTTDLGAFWSAAWDYLGLVSRTPYRRVHSDNAMPHTRWFEGAELNLVDQMFRYRQASTPAIVYESETAGSGEVSWPELERQVAAIAAMLRRLGVTRGDRVVGYLPNVPQTIVAFLATASIGAVWSVCAADMGPVSVVDRFRQIRPKVLIACDGYRFGGRAIDRRECLRSILGDLPSVESVIWVSPLGATAEIPATIE